MTLCSFLYIFSPTVKASFYENILIYSESNAQNSDDLSKYVFNDELSKRSNQNYAVNVRITHESEQIVIDTPLLTVGELLDDKNIKINYNEGVYPEKNTIIGDNMQIFVDKIQTRSETTTDTEEFQVERVEDNTVRIGQENVIQSGQNGLVQNTSIIKEVSGNLIEKKSVFSIRLSEPVNEIIRVGTYNPPKPSESIGTIVTVPDSDVKQYALEQIRQRGWDDSEFSCLEQLWQRESGWRPTAGNVISGAYGIPQALPGSKMASEGDDWRTNPMTQIRWGLGYVKGRYGSPCNAWHSWQSHGWY